MFFFVFSAFSYFSLKIVFYNASLGTAAVAPTAFLPSAIAGIRGAAGERSPTCTWNLALNYSRIRRTFVLIKISSNLPLNGSAVLKGCHHHITTAAADVPQV